MDLMETIRARRAVRDFSDVPLDKQTIERLIQAAVQAPSAMNLQPWAFGVVTGRQRIDTLGARAKDYLLKHFPRAGHEASLRSMVEDPHYALLHHAPAFLLVLAKSDQAQAIEDCCLAAENFMLAARNEGIGTCWIGFARPWLNLSSTKAELKIPEDYHVVAPIIFGYPKEWPQPHGRNEAEIHWLE